MKSENGVYQPLFGPPGIRDTKLEFKLPSLENLDRGSHESAAPGLIALAGSAMLTLQEHATFRELHCGPQAGNRPLFFWC